MSLKYQSRLPKKLIITQSVLSLEIKLNLFKPTFLFNLILFMH